jgi:hypothetical protein
MSQDSPSLHGLPLRCGADLYREGFGRGFRHALQLVARQLPPESWAVLDQIANAYDLAGCDG